MESKEAKDSKKTEIVEKKDEKELTLADLPVTTEANKIIVPQLFESFVIVNCKIKNKDKFSKLVKMSADKIQKGTPITGFDFLNDGFGLDYMIECITGDPKATVDLLNDALSELE